MHGSVLHAEEHESQDSSHTRRGAQGTRNGEAIFNGLSGAAWCARFLFAAYSASKSAVWSCTNGLASRPQDGSARLACDLHAHRHAVDMKKTSPRQGKKAALIGLEASVEVVLVAP